MAKVYLGRCGSVPDPRATLPGATSPWCRAAIDTAARRGCRRRRCAVLRSGSGSAVGRAEAADACRRPARCPSPCCAPPARTLLSLPRPSPTRKGAMRRCAVVTLVGAGDGRGSQLAGSAGWGRRRARDRQHGRRRRRVAASLCSVRVMNGGGCAASVLNQWRRLRRGEYLGGPNGRCQHGQLRNTPTILPCVATAGQPARTADVLGSAALSAGYAANWRRKSAGASDRLVRRQPAQISCAERAQLHGGYRSSPIPSHDCQVSFPAVAPVLRSRTLVRPSS